MVRFFLSAQLGVLSLERVDRYAADRALVVDLFRAARGPAAAEESEASSSGDAGPEAEPSAASPSSSSSSPPPLPAVVLCAVRAAAAAGSGRAARVRSVGGRRRACGRQARGCGQRRRRARGGRGIKRDASRGLLWARGDGARRASHELKVAGAADEPRRPGWCRAHPNEAGLAALTAALLAETLAVAVADRSARALGGAAAVPAWSLGVVAVGAVLAYAAVLAVAEAERFDGARRRAADAALARLPRSQDTIPEANFISGRQMGQEVGGDGGRR